MPKPLSTPPTIPEGVKPNAISASYSVTINLGNYESARVEQTVSADLDWHTDIAAAQEWATNMAKYGARAAILPLLARRKESIDSIWQNLPADLKAELEGQY